MLDGMSAAQIIVIYAYTFCHRTTKFDMVTPQLTMEQ